MQIKAYFTEEQIKKNNDPLFLACHPLGKLKMVSTLICNEDENINPFETFRSGEVFAIGEMIDAAADEIDFLIDVENERVLNARKDLEKLIQAEDQQMETLRKTDPGKANEKFCYILGLTKALTIIKVL